MRLTATEFENWDKKSITLLGMSGVGKTYLSNRLRRAHWFHYSGDYRIGTRYLDEAILDNLKQQVMQVAFLRDLMRSDSIYIRNNLTIDNLTAVSSYLGMVGNPELGGLPLKSFKHRQRLHKEAEIAAMNDVPDFIRKAHEIYGYDHFINDAGGSLCELDDERVLKTLADHTLILYIQATDEDEKAVLERAESSPKPMFYREDFLAEHLPKYLTGMGFEYVAQVDPSEFVRWVFPRLFSARKPRYEAIANQYAYTVSSAEVADVESEQDFIRLVMRAINRQQGV